MPAAIFASRIEAGETSRRPRRTVEPLAAALGLPVDHRFGHDGEVELARLLRESAAPSLVCWHHEGIPDLAALITGGLQVPSTWPPDRFDLIWTLDRPELGAAWSLIQVPQLLLPGDRADSIV